MVRLAFATIAVLTLLSPANASAQCDSYYVIVFGAQRPIIKNPAHSHSFATFVHTCPDGRLESFTISWLPATGRVRPFALCSEPGRNYSLGETLQFGCENGMEVAAWGPYQIEPDLWNRAQIQKDRLDSGEVAYKANDLGSPDGMVTNCIHAISFMAREPGQRAPFVNVAPFNWGESGSYWIALTFRPWYPEPCCTHDEIFAALGLDANSFKRWGPDRNPSRNPFTRVLQATLQSYLLPNRVFCDR